MNFPRSSGLESLGAGSSCFDLSRRLVTLMSMLIGYGVYATRAICFFLQISTFHHNCSKHRALSALLFWFFAGECCGHRQDTVVHLSDRDSSNIRFVVVGGVLQFCFSLSFRNSPYLMFLQHWLAYYLTAKVQSSWDPRCGFYSVSVDFVGEKTDVWLWNSAPHCIPQFGWHDCAGLMRQMPHGGTCGFQCSPGWQAAWLIFWKVGVELFERATDYLTATFPKELSAVVWGVLCQ